MPSRRRDLGHYPRVRSVGRAPGYPVELDRGSTLNYGLAGYWPMHDGRVVDYTLNRDSGSLVGGPPVSLGPCGPWLSGTNASTQYASIPAAASINNLRAFGVSLWFQSSVDTVPTVAKSSPTVPVNGWTLLPKSGYGVLDFWSGASRYYFTIGPPNFNDGKLHHFAFSADGSWPPTQAGTLFWVDGAQITTPAPGTNGSPASPGDDSANPLVVGVNGAWGNLAVFSRALTNADVMMLYAAPYGLLRPSVRRKYYAVSATVLTNIAAFTAMPGESLSDGIAWSVGGADVLTDATAAAGLGLDALTRGAAINVAAADWPTSGAVMVTFASDWLASGTAVNATAGDWTGKAAAMATIAVDAALSSLAPGPALLDTLGTPITNQTALGNAGLDWLADGAATTVVACDVLTGGLSRAATASDWLASGAAQTVAGGETLIAATAYATGLSDSLGSGAINITAFGSGALEWTAASVSLENAPFEWMRFLLATSTTVPPFTRTTLVPRY